MSQLNHNYKYMTNQIDCQDPFIKLYYISNFWWFLVEFFSRNVTINTSLKITTLDRHFTYTNLQRISQFSINHFSHRLNCDCSEQVDNTTAHYTSRSEFILRRNNKMRRNFLLLLTRGPREMSNSET